MLWGVQRNELSGTAYNWLTSGLSLWLVSAVADVMDEVVQQPRWLSAFGEDLMRVFGMALVACGVFSLMRHARRVHQQLNSLANTDELTGLMTRAGVRRALASAQAKARRNQTMLAVLFIDLDDFKPVNDRFGHAVGDRVLVAVAERLQASLRESDLLARLGGDEFLVIAEDIGEPLVAAELARKMKAALTEGFEFEAQTLRVRASIGVALYPSDGEGDALVELADAAMYDAKRGGEGGFRFASPWLNAQFEREVEIERRWRDVMNEGSLALGWRPLLAACWASRPICWPRRAAGSNRPGSKPKSAAWGKRGFGFTFRR
jgi:diguanylate cyclase (GGDEF)-like protein